MFCIFISGHNFKNEELNITRSMEIECTCLPALKKYLILLKEKQEEK